MRRYCIATLWLVVTLVSAIAHAGDKSPTSLVGDAHFRRPVAACLVKGGKTLCVANERSGSISVVDIVGVPPRETNPPAERDAYVTNRSSATDTSGVRDEIAVGKKLADLVVLPDGKRLLAVDEAEHELIALDYEQGGLQVRQRLKVSPFPATVAVAVDGRSATVACRWSRKLDVIDLASGTLKVVRSIDLPFAPRNQLPIPAGRVVVADAFAGRLAIVDTSAGKIVAQQELAAHNIRGLSLSGDDRKLLVAHQKLNQQAPTTRDVVWNGWLIANELTSVDLASLSVKDDEIPLGDGIDGAGDPAGMVAVDDEHLAICLSGVDELAIVRNEYQAVTERIGVGRRPTAVVAGGKGRAYVVNTLSDSISIVDYRSAVVLREISLGLQPPLRPRDRGERLFYDARLAAGEWFSCHSCHTDGHTNGLRADTFGDYLEGAAKRTPTLLGTSLTDPWAWNGERRELREQVKKSVETTMHSEPHIKPSDMDDLVAYLHTLSPPPPREPARDDPADRQRLERGQQMFARNRCASCHVPSLTFTSPAAYDVGLVDELGRDKFNPPSLRGVGQGYRYFHDNRAATLEEVFTKFGHQLQEDISPQDVSDLVRYLRSL